MVVQHSNGKKYVKKLTRFLHPIMLPPFETVPSIITCVAALSYWVMFHLNLMNCPRFLSRQPARARTHSNRSNLAKQFAGDSLLSFGGELQRRWNQLLYATRSLLFRALFSELTDEGLRDAYERFAEWIGWTEMKHVDLCSWNGSDSLS